MPGLISRLSLSPAAPAPRPGLPPRTWGVAPVGESDDLTRVLALPSREPPSLEEQDAMAEVMTRRLELHRRPCPCRIHRLLPIQGWYLTEAERVGGVLGHVVAGGGKTLIGILLPMVLPGVKTAVMLIPPALRAQFASQYEEAQAHFQVPNLAGGRGKFVSGRPVLHVLAYSELSHERCATWLAQHRPDLVIADEVQALADKTSVRTSRFLRYFLSRETTGETPVRYACHSGTLTTSSLDQYAHHATLSLRESSPLPLATDAVREWCAALDPMLRGAPAPAGSLRRLCRGDETPREGFRRRLITSPGVITTHDATLPVSLSLGVREPPPAPPEVLAALDLTRGDAVRPDGEELVEQTEVAACLRQLASGFFYRWVYPRGESVDLIERWFAARKAWFAELRRELEGVRRDNVDSPKLLRVAAERWHDPAYQGEAPEWASKAWPAWRDVRELVVPSVATQWISDWLVQDVVAWGRSHVGVIWYGHRAFGEAVARAGGWRLYGGGDEASALLLEDRGESTVVASIKAHGTGKNMQAWCEALVTHVASDGGVWEQLLARHHRTGQRRDVRVWHYRHTAELRQALDDARERARYVHGTTGMAQRLLYAEPLDTGARAR